jgi:hypothetical protein
MKRSTVLASLLLGAAITTTTAFSQPVKNTCKHDVTAILSHIVTDSCGCFTDSSHITNIRGWNKLNPGGPGVPALIYNNTQQHCNVWSPKQLNQHKLDPTRRDNPSCFLLHWVPGNWGNTLTFTEYIGAMKHQHLYSDCNTTPLPRKATYGPGFIHIQPGAVYDVQSMSR